MYCGNKNSVVLRGVNFFLRLVPWLFISWTHAETFTIDTPGGAIQVNVPHVAPEGSLVSPKAPTSPSFNPPSIFSAPLPSGSGARALGLGGAFTAVADDATAASWNPAGLVQLETPEASVVLRGSYERDRHRSSSKDLLVGNDSYFNENVNYLSAVYPFRAGKNMVFSLNYQEAYDFEQKFKADMHDTATSTAHKKSSGTFSDTVVDRFDDGVIDIDVTSFLTTHKTSTLNEVLTSDLLTALDFEQQGTIYAVTPAWAVEVTPNLSFGASLNLYQDGGDVGQGIESRTKADYSGHSDAKSTITSTETTSGSYSYEGVLHLPPSGSFPGIDVPVPATTGVYPSFSDTRTTTKKSHFEYDGQYEEVNEFSDLHGVNATLGTLWTVSRHLSLGAAVDLPWRADAQQKKTVHNKITTLNSTRTTVLDVSQTDSVETKDVEFQFPLYWAVGGVYRWTDRFYTTLDVSQTKWSDFAFEADGQERVNIVGDAAGSSSKIDDTWAVRSGLEYLLVFSKTEIPLRAGVGWEQRPAPDSPDEYWSLSLGSGVSVGKKDGKLIIDLAYVYTAGEDTLSSAASGQPALSTDVQEHQVFVSCIKHF